MGFKTRPPGVSQLRRPSALHGARGVRDPKRRRAAGAAGGDPRAHGLRVGTGAEGGRDLESFGDGEAWDVLSGIFGLVGWW